MTSTALRPSVRARPVTQCGLCGSGDLTEVLNLGSSPPPCVMHPVGRRPLIEEHYPLELLRCSECSLVQLSVIVDPEVVFAPDFPYASGNSRQLHRNFENLANEIDGHLGGLRPDDLVVDIGANDGTLLSKFADCRTVGVEPTRQARKIPVAYEAFFDAELAQRILDRYGPAKVVTACNVMAHVDDLDDVMRGIDILLAHDGVFVAENHDLAAVMDGQWDMVYHEHLRFYSPHSFARLLNRYDLGCVRWQKTSTHGGSFRMFASRDHEWIPEADDYDFDRLRRDTVRSRSLIRHAVSQGPVIGIGATARGTTIINYCGLDADDIECVCEVPQSEKIGHYIPGTSIPVVDEKRLFEDPARLALLLSWHLADGIMPKLREQGYDQPAIVPLPNLRYV